MVKQSEIHKYRNERLAEALEKREHRAAEWNVILDPVSAAQLSYVFEAGNFKNLEEYLTFVAPTLFKRICNEQLELPVNFN